jgi:hypothetical protein
MMTTNSRFISCLRQGAHVDRHPGRRSDNTCIAFVPLSSSSAPRAGETTESSLRREMEATLEPWMSPLLRRQRGSRRVRRESFARPPPPVALWTRASKPGCCRTPRSPGPPTPISQRLTPHSSRSSRGLRPARIVRVGEGRQADGNPGHHNSRQPGKTRRAKECGCAGVRAHREAAGSRCSQGSFGPRPSSGGTAPPASSRLSIVFRI